MSIIHVQVADGYRPEIPRHMPKDVAGIITSCWAENPSDRPYAYEIRARLKVRAVEAFSLEMQ